MLWKVYWRICWASHRFAWNVVQLGSLLYVAMVFIVGVFRCLFVRVRDPRLYQPWCGSFMILIQSKHNMNASDFGTNSWQKKGWATSDCSRGWTSNAGNRLFVGEGWPDFPRGSRPTSSGSHPMRWDCQNNVAWVRRNWSAARSPIWCENWYKRDVPNKSFWRPTSCYTYRIQEHIIFIYLHLPWTSTKG